MRPRSLARLHDRVGGVGISIRRRFARRGHEISQPAEPKHMSSFGAEAVSYIGLAHAVLGGVMFGWGLRCCLSFAAFSHTVQNWGGNSSAFRSSRGSYRIPSIRYGLASGRTRRSTSCSLFSPRFHCWLLIGCAIKQTPDLRSN